MGVISQFRLWRVVRQRRLNDKHKLDEEKAKQDETESELGRRLQEDHLRERVEWEEMYGGGPETTTTSSTNVADFPEEEWKKEKAAAGSDTAKDNPVETDVIEVSSQRSFRCSECRADEEENGARSPQASVPADDTQEQFDGEIAEGHEGHVSGQGGRSETLPSVGCVDRVAAGAAKAKDDDQSDIAAVAGSEAMTPRSSRQFSRSSSFSGAMLGTRSRETRVLLGAGYDSDSNSSKEVMMDDGSEWSRDCRSISCDGDHEIDDVDEMNLNETKRSSERGENVEAASITRDATAEEETINEQNNAGRENTVKEAVEQRPISQIGDSQETVATHSSDIRKESESDDLKPKNEDVSESGKAVECERSVRDNSSPVAGPPVATPQTMNEADTGSPNGYKEPVESSDSHVPDPNAERLDSDDNSTSTVVPAAISESRNGRDTSSLIDSKGPVESPDDHERGLESEKPASEAEHEKPVPSDSSATAARTPIPEPTNEEDTTAMDAKEPGSPDSDEEEVNSETGSREAVEARNQHAAPTRSVSPKTQEPDIPRASEAQKSLGRISSSNMSSNTEDQKERTDTSPSDQASADQKSASASSRAKSKSKARREKLERVELNAEAVKELPERSSRIVQTYRTNEWAKHLADAETPGPEPIMPVPEEHLETSEEVAAPVNEEELLQTPLNAQPPPMVSSETNGTRGMSNATDLQTNSPQLNTENNQAWKSSPGLIQNPSASSPRLSIPTQPQRGSLKDIRSVSNPLMSGAARAGSLGEDVESVSAAKPKWTGPPPLMALREDRVRSRLSLTSLGHDPWSSRSKPGQSSLDLVAPQPSPTFAIPEEDEEDLPLSQRREMLHQQRNQLNRPVPQRGSQSFSRRDSSPAVMAAWRQSIREDLSQKRDPLGWHKSTSFGVESRQSPSTLEDTIAQGMQRGELNDLHREAMRRMQAAAYRHGT